MDTELIKDKIINILSNSTTPNYKLQAVCDYLKQTISYYDWVGFYFKNGHKKELKLFQYSGEPTEHVIIPFGKGICGQAAISNENFVVQNVSEQDNYISCGWKVKSEIVIPIIIEGNNIGQIDIDSHTKNPFTDSDIDLLEFICKEIAKLEGIEILWNQNHDNSNKKTF
jgi:GAF domain-containing protein